MFTTKRGVKVLVVKFEAGKVTAWIGGNPKMVIHLDEFQINATREQLKEAVVKNESNS